MVITDLGVFTIDKKGGGGMTLIELAPGVTLDEIKAKTEANFKVAVTAELTRHAGTAAPEKRCNYGAYTICRPRKRHRGGSRLRAAVPLGYSRLGFRAEPHWKHAS